VFGVWEFGLRRKQKHSLVSSRNKFFWLVVGGLLVCSPQAWLEVRWKKPIRQINALGDLANQCLGRPGKSMPWATWQINALGYKPMTQVCGLMVEGIRNSCFPFSQP
jgi:hypothetical protein